MTPESPSWPNELGSTPHTQHAKCCRPIRCAEISCLDRQRYPRAVHSYAQWKCHDHDPSILRGLDEQVRQTVHTVRESYGAIDYLVNNAAITRQLPFSDLEAIEDSAWDDLYAVNVKGAFYAARAAAPFMRARPAAAIVNVGSIAGVTGFGSSLPYAVSKAALHGLTRSLARALAPKIRVNAVVPGMVDPRWWDGNEAKMHQLAGNVALERVAAPSDIADLVLNLLSAKAMTAQLIIADNGQTL